ncbi:hypothetical protein CPB84DRAFT_1786602 [Gymnopilus junonius]|uniref:F-box domain-containing protein n=1 Tax=Gymnopilus junonius TaxID=109634 RepID=A0A9P5NFR1_GYMJU|nr:hypothetical protein CPB84DRAFT_1786602 [Gymnopilus junonius]
MATRMHRLAVSIPFTGNNNSNTTKNSTKSIGLKFSLSLPRGTSATSESNIPNNAEFASPVPHLLRSNFPPSDSEGVLIQDAIDRVSAQNEALLSSTSSNSTKPSPGTLKRLESGLEFVQIHKSILSPLRLLPEEILGDIFSIYSNSFLLAEHPHIVTLSTHGITYPWNPSQVCRSWRSAALSLHHLWGQLIVDTCLWKSRKPSKSFLGLFATLIDRSHDAPLCIYFCTPPNTDVGALRPIIDVLVSHSERWSTVYLITPYSVVNAFQGIKGRLLALSRLYLSFGIEQPIDGAIPDSNDMVVDTFEIAPKLRSMYLSTTSFSGRVLLPYSQFLVFLEGGERANGHAREHILPSSSSTLIDLSFARFPMDDLQKPWPKMDLPQVTHLDMKFENVNEEDDLNDNLQDNFFGNLSLPNIQSLSIANYPKNILPVLSSFILRSSHCMMLQSLSFSTYFLAEHEPGELGAFFELTPYLKRLSVYLPHPTDLMRLVARPESDLPLLPRLEELYIFVYDTLEGYEDVLSNIASSRCEPVEPSDCFPYSSSLSRPTRLKHFRLVFPGAVLCHAGHEMMESWSSSALPRIYSAATTKAFEERLGVLKDWTPLANSLPSIFSYFWSSSHKMGLTKIKKAFQVSQWFSMVESVKIEGAKELYLSDIHHLMYHISSLSSSEVPGDNIYHFRKRARALLDKWSTFLPTISGTGSGHSKGHRALSMSPGTHAIMSLIYGDKFLSAEVVLQFQD